MQTFPFVSVLIKFSFYLPKCSYLQIYVKYLLPFLPLGISIFGTQTLANSQTPTHLLTAFPPPSVSWGKKIGRMEWQSRWETKRQIFKQHISFSLSQTRFHSFTSDFSTPALSGIRTMRSVNYGQYRMISLCCSSLLRLLPCSSIGTIQATVPSGTATCCGLRSYMGCSVDICSRVFVHGLHGASFLLWSTSSNLGIPPPVYFLFCWLLLLLLWGCLFCFVLFFSSLSVHPFLPFIEYISRGTHILAEGPSCALAWVHGVSWNRLSLTWGSPSLSSQNPPL